MKVTSARSAVASGARASADLGSQLAACASRRSPASRPAPGWLLQTTHPMTDGRR